MAAEAAPADDPILGVMFILTVDTGFCKVSIAPSNLGPKPGCAWLTDRQRAALARSCALFVCFVPSARGRSGLA